MAGNTNTAKLLAVNPEIKFAGEAHSEIIIYCTYPYHYYNYWPSSSTSCTILCIILLKTKAAASSTWLKRFFRGYSRIASCH